MYRGHYFTGDDALLVTDRELENLHPGQIIEVFANDMKNSISKWNDVVRQSMEAEAMQMAKFENLLKQAYVLEAECLKEKLERVKRRIEGKI
ncbi:uncharacterized protein LOC118196222 isoform X2 [Stegodyphus dumicola]|uniref:uncharacterized protein LOC118196222 isoform X2 n=1 Tax=Stegodyphus dumicola TaxID=202533 RepID=UPI0015B34120|nr:uncharacterized protein LOC118196222 isoform X2 [Stegodyphus dumicola]